jgi:hypothetical protein
MSKLNVTTCSDLELIQALESKFEDLSHIVPDGTNRDGERVFRCLDIGAESILTVDTEGWVKSKAINSKFADVLGTV